MSTPTPVPALEVWLRTPWRRILLVAAGVLLLAGTTSALWADAMIAVDQEVDWGRTFQRRLIEWGLWGVAFEPLVALSAVVAKLLKPALLLLVAHAGLSVGTAFAVYEADQYLSEQWLGRQSFSRGGFDPRGFDRRGPGRRGGRSGRSERGDGDERAAIPEQEPDEAQRLLREAQEEELRREERARVLAGRQRFGRNVRAQSGIVIYWLIIGLGWAGRSFLRHRAQERRTAELELRTAKLEADLGSAQLSQLEAQLHPHFLFNALHSVGGLVREGRQDLALSTLAALGDLLRATLEHGDTPEVALADELDLVETYLDLERIRLGERLEVSLETEPGTGRTTVPALLLLPLAENAVKHGIAPRPEGGRLEISARREGAQVVVEVRDDGPGFPEDVLAGAGAAGPGGGIGLANTRARAEAFFGPGALRLDNPEGGGARVTLRIPQERP